MAGEKDPTPADHRTEGEREDVASSQYAFESVGRDVKICRCSLEAFSRIAMADGRAFEFPLGHKKFEVVIANDNGLELWLDGCLRKRREPSSREPLYVWTNVELLWEEHRYVEARFFPSSGMLEVTVNGELVDQRAV